MIEAFKIFLNPTVILGCIGIFVLTSGYHGLTSWIENRSLVRPWVLAVQERDRAAKQKDAILETVSADRDKAANDYETLKQEFENAETARKNAGVHDCVWTDNDRRLLNATSARKRR